MGTLGGKLPAESAKYLPRVVLGMGKKQLEKQRDEVGAAFCPVGHALEFRNSQDSSPLLQAVVSLPGLSRALSLIILGMAKKQLEKGPDEVGAASSACPTKNRFCPAPEFQNSQDLSPLLQAVVSLPRTSPWLFWEWPKSHPSTTPQSPRSVLCQILRRN